MAWEFRTEPEFEKKPDDELGPVVRRLKRHLPARRGRARTQLANL